MFKSLEQLQEAERLMIAQALPTLDKEKIEATQAFVKKIEDFLEASKVDNTTVLFTLHTILFSMAEQWIMKLAPSVKKTPSN